MHIQPVRTCLCSLFLVKLIIKYNRFPETSLYDSVFHYIHSEENFNAVLISPLKSDSELIESEHYFTVMTNFTNCCVKIKKLFDMQDKVFFLSLQITMLKFVLSLYFDRVW